MAEAAATTDAIVQHLGYMEAEAAYWLMQGPVMVCSPQEKEEDPQLHLVTRLYTGLVDNYGADAELRSQLTGEFAELCMRELPNALPVLEKLVTLYRALPGKLDPAAAAMVEQLAAKRGALSLGELIKLGETLKYLIMRLPGNIINGHEV